MIINANTRTRLIQHVKSFFDYISSAYGRFTSLEIALNTGCFEQLNFDVSTLTHPPCAPIFIYNGYSIYCYGHRYYKGELRVHKALEKPGGLKPVMTIGA